MNRSNNKLASKTEIACFRTVATIATALNIATVPLNAAGLGTGATRFAAMLDLYGLYRLLKFRFRIVKSTAELQALAVVSEYQDSTASTVALMNEAICSQVYAAAETVRLPFVEVPRQIIAGALPWYKSIPGSIDSWEEIPASLLAFTTAATGSVLIELEWVAEFKDQIPPANTPELRLSRQKAALDAERLRLLGVITGGHSSGAPLGSIISAGFCAKPPSAPAKTDCEQTRPLAGDSDLRGKLVSAQISAMLGSGK